MKSIARALQDARQVVSDIPQCTLMATEAEGQHEVWKAGVWDVAADAEREVGVSGIWKDHKNHLWGVGIWCIDVTGEPNIFPTPIYSSTVQIGK